MADQTPTVETTPGNVSTIDIYHPYFHHSSDYPGMNLVNSTFDGKSFLGWRRSMLLTLSVKKKLGFIRSEVFTV